MSYDRAYFDELFNSVMGSGMPPQEAMPFAPQPTAMSIPMPRPRPAEAPVASPLDQAVMQQPSAQPAMMAQAQMVDEENPLARMFGLTSPNLGRTLRSSIASGMKGVADGWNKPAGAAFASGFGGALKGAEDAEQYGEARGDKSVTQRLELIDRAIRAKVAGNNAEYERAMIDLRNRELEEVKKAKAATDADYKSGRLRQYDDRNEIDRDYKSGRLRLDERNTATREKDSEAYRANVDRGTARSELKSKIEIDRLLQRERVAADKAAGLDQVGLTDKQRVERQAKADTIYKAREAEILSRTAPSAANPAAAPTAPAVPGRLPEIRQSGQGTKDNPYSEPKTQQEFDDMERGVYFIYNDGSGPKVYLKK